MIERYSREEIKNIWNDYHTYYLPLNNFLKKYISNQNYIENFQYNKRNNKKNIILLILILIIIILIHTFINNVYLN